MTKLLVEEDKKNYSEFRPPPWSSLPTDYRLLIVAVSVGFGFFLASRPLLEFKDRNNYINYFLNSERLLERGMERGLSSFLSNEPLWLLLVRFGDEYFGPELGLKLLIGLPAAMVSFTVLRFGPKNLLWIIIFLTIPVVITNHVIHLRQGLAVSIFIISYFLVRNRKMKVFLIFLCAFIHSSFFFIFLLWVLSRTLRTSKINGKLAVLILLVACATIALFLPSLLDLTEARQASSLEFSGDNVSGLGFLFWGSILILILSSGEKVIRKNAFPITLLVFYCSTYFIFEYAGRVLESGVLVVFMALLALPSNQKNISLLACLFFYALLWFSRIGSPGLGWGLN